MKPYQISAEKTANLFGTNISQGLSNENVAHLKKKYGKNSIPVSPPESWFKIFIRQFASPLIYILLLAALIIFFFAEDKIDAFIISFILFFNAIIGTIQEGRASRILVSLRDFVADETVVVRNGKTCVVRVEDLVPGDLVLLQEGERVPADIRLIESHALHIDEALLTGESMAVEKDSQLVAGQQLPLAEQRNMVFKGTYIVRGGGKGIVVATGLNTEIGKIQQVAQELQADMPIKRELDRLARWILFGVLAACTALFVIGLFTGRPVNELLVTLTALFVCVIPEGLPVVLTLVLVSGVYRMAKHRALVKRIQAAEALGRTDIIVIDKTGTLTRNEMMVVETFVDGRYYQVTGEGYNSAGEFYSNGQKITDVSTNETFGMLASAAALLSNAQVTFSKEEKRFIVKGDPTEAALAVFAKKVGFTKEMVEQEFQQVCEMPFNPQSRYHASFYRHGNTGIAFIIGAPEIILQNSSVHTQEPSNALNEMLAQGLRVVAVAMKKIPLEVLSEQECNPARCEQLLKNDLTFLGLCGIQDAIRSDVAEVIQKTRDAGLKIIMATGDHLKTALYVARKVHIFKEGDQAIDGRELLTLSDKQLQERLPAITVFARVSPSDKLRIIQLWHERGKMVAMTGDGVNDVPSLVAADVGLAMGGIGTEVAKESADIVLLDDSFANIVTAIELGRHIFYTLRRVILYFFATNMGEVLIIFFALSAYFFDPTYPLPLTAAQILWLNLITDGFLDTALTAEPRENGMLTKKWLQNSKRLIDGPILTKAFFMAIPMAVGSLLVFTWFHHGDLRFARTMTLITMAMFQWFNAWNCRSEKSPLVCIGLFSNKWLLLATSFVFMLQIALVYWPPLQYIFKTVPLSLCDWLIIVLISSSVLIMEELRKVIVRLWRYGSLC